MARGVNGIWPCGDLLAGADDAHHRGAHLFDGDFERVEDARRHAFLLAEQAEQQVLGADVVVLEGARLFLGEDHDLPGAFGEAFEHAGNSFQNGGGASMSGDSGTATARAVCVLVACLVSSVPFGDLT